MKISVSILDAVDRYEAVSQLNGSDIDYFHIDIMDGQFVPNIQFQDMKELQKISQMSRFPLQIHLMVNDVLKYLSKLSHLNIESVTFHLEDQDNIESLIQAVRGLGYRVGIAICNETDISLLVPYLDKIDMVLFMSVVPGRGGQSFIKNTSKRIADLKDYIKKNHLSVVIEVDGGINNETIAFVKDADVVVVGSYIIKSDDYDARIQSLFF